MPKGMPYGLFDFGEQPSRAGTERGCMARIPVTVSDTQQTLGFEQHPSTDDISTRLITTPPTSGSWRVTVQGAGGGHTVALRYGCAVVVGSGVEAQLRVDDPHVSRRHCRLEATPGGVRLIDLDSRNGVRVGGVKISSALLFAPETSIVVGHTTLRVSNARVVEAPPIAGLIGSSPGMKRLVEHVRCFAPHDVSVLIQGETGTGKELVARALHELSGRRGPFVAVNIGGMSESLADAELFGHRRGAFTGAIGDRKGAFEQAASGTLFLDEIGDVSPVIQVKLLRALEEKRIRPLGAERETAVDVRVVAASWANLEAYVTAGKFRLDLYHRLSTAVVRVPALRERKGDIATLARHFLALDAGKNDPPDITPDAIERLQDQPWEGNVRELRAVLRRVALLSTTGVISALEVEAHLAVPVKKAREPVSSERAQAALQEHAGNVSAAARACGLPRSTFRGLLANARFEALKIAADG
jgi:transcriptional regulator with AAA-type ATPase domain